MKRHEFTNLSLKVAIKRSQIRFLFVIGKAIVYFVFISISLTGAMAGINPAFKIII